VTKGELLKFLEDEIKGYRKGAIASLERSKHMHNCGNLRVSQDFIDALLVDSVNNIAAGQGID
jgi:hypothetical protein